MGNSLPMLFLFLAGQPESLHMEKLDGPKKIQNPLDISA
jgi:hypothetical protein